MRGEGEVRGSGRGTRKERQTSLKHQSVVKRKGHVKGRSRGSGKFNWQLRVGPGEHEPPGWREVDRFELTLDL